LKLVDTFVETVDLFSLPNEVLDIIFEFLSSTDLIQSIFPLNHHRLNGLIYSRISRINLITFPDEYLNAIFPLISSVRITSNQINKIRLAPSLCSLLIEQTDPIDFSFLSFLPHLVRHLKSLLLHLHKNCNMDKLLLAALIFQSNCTLETLTIYSDKTPMSIELSHIALCLSLKRVTLSLVSHYDLFILCEHLLSLEYFRVILSVYNDKDHSFNFDQYVLEKSFSKHLRELSIGVHVNYTRIELFTQQFASSLEYLMFNIATWEEPVDGYRLERGLIDVCTKLKQFKFHFTFNGYNETPISYESFQSNSDVSLRDE
jgi:hypothetical protein